MAPGPAPELVRLAVDDHVATVTLNRPEAMNALSAAMADQVAGAVLQAAAQPEVWVVVLAAEGERAFSVGADLKERAGLDDAGWLRNRILMRGMFDAVRSIPQPTIASVFGYALGGGFELALSCDLIVASEDAEFGLPEARVGILPGGGGTQLLARKVGPSLAKELIFTGRRLTASEARDVRLVARVVPRAELRAATLELAKEICRSAPVSVREAKWAVDRGTELPLQHGIELEDLAWRRVLGTEDRREGIDAFTEKREPRWKGR
jgi:enoyl-CoA hydratase/carnithine racemase